MSTTSSLSINPNSPSDTPTNTSIDDLKEPDPLEPNNLPTQVFNEYIPRDVLPDRHTLTGNHPLPHTNHQLEFFLWSAELYEDQPPFIDDCTPEALEKHQVYSTTEKRYERTEQSIRQHFKRFEDYEKQKYGIKKEYFKQDMEKEDWEIYRDQLSALGESPSPVRMRPCVIVMIGILDTLDTISVAVPWMPPLVVEVPDGWTEKEAKYLVKTCEFKLNLIEGSIPFTVKKAMRHKGYIPSEEDVMIPKKFTYVEMRLPNNIARNALINKLRYGKEGFRIHDLGTFPIILTEHRIQSLQLFIDDFQLSYMGWVGIKPKQWRPFPKRMSTTTFSAIVPNPKQHVYPLTKSDIPGVLLVSFDEEVNSSHPEGGLPTPELKHDVDFISGNTIGWVGGVPKSKPPRCLGIEEWKPNEPFVRILFVVEKQKGMYEQYGKAGERGCKIYDKDGVIVVLCKKEYDMHEQLRHLWAVRLDVDIITGYNILNFDMRIHRDRTSDKAMHPKQRMSGMKKPFFHYLNRLPFKHSKPNFAREEDEDAYLICNGRILFDFLPWAKKNLQLGNYKLTTVSKELLKNDQDKHDVHYKKIFEAYQKGNEYDIRIITLYCAQDCDLVFKLFCVKLLLYDYTEMARITNTNFWDLLFRGQMIKGLNQFVRDFHKQGYMINDLYDNPPYTKYKGGYVADMVPGLYDEDPVCVLDFASLYPTIMRGYNLCYSSVINNPELLFNLKKLIRKGLKVHTHSSTLEGGPKEHVFVERKGVIPDILKELADGRTRAKAEKARAVAWLFIYKRLKNEVKKLLGHSVKDAIMSVKNEFLTQYPFIDIDADKKKRFKPADTPMEEDRRILFLLDRIPLESVRTLASLLLQNEDIDDTTLDVLLKNIEAELHQQTVTKAIMHARQLNLKLSANSVYGIAGTAGKSGIDPCFEFADTVTSIGRNSVQLCAVKAKEWEDAIEVYGDSVLSDTAILIRINGMMMVKRIDDLCDTYVDVKYNDCCVKEMGIMEDDVIEVWTEHGFTRLFNVIRHKVRKKMVRVMTKNGYVDVTSDHSLLKVERDEVFEATPNEIKLGDSLLSRQVDYEVEGEVYISNEDAYRMGQTVYENEEGDRIVPDDVFQFGKEQVQSYLDGCKSGFENGMIINDSKCFLTSLSILAHHVNLYTEFKSGSSGLGQTIMITSSTHTRDGNCITGITELEDKDQYVYDLTTSNHHFHVGPGSLIVHNTDSIMVRYDLKNRMRHEDWIHPGRRIKEAFRISDRVCERLTNLFPRPMEQEMEGTLFPAIFTRNLNAKESNKGAKKKYVAIKIEPEDLKDLRDDGSGTGKVYARGIEIVRRDNFPMTRSLSKKVIDIQLFERDASKALNVLKEELMNLVNGKTDIKELVTSKSYRGNYSDRTVCGPHVAVANAEALNTRGYKPMRGDRIEYVFVRESDIRRMGADGVYYHEKKKDERYMKPGKRGRRDEVDIDLDPATNTAKRMGKHGRSKARVCTFTEEQLIKSQSSKARSIEEIANDPEHNHVDYEYYISHLHKPILKLFPDHEKDVNRIFKEAMDMRWAETTGLKKMKVKKGKKHKSDIFDDDYEDILIKPDNSSKVTKKTEVKIKTSRLNSKQSKDKQSKMSVIKPKVIKKMSVKTKTSEDDLEDMF